MNQPSWKSFSPAGTQKSSGMGNHFNSAVLMVSTEFLERTTDHRMSGDLGEILRGE